MLEYRIMQLEIAISNLMKVVAFPEDRLEKFKSTMEGAIKMTESDDKILELIGKENKGAEA